MICKVLESIRSFFYRLRGKRIEWRFKVEKKSRWKWFAEEEVAGLDYEFIVSLDRAREISKTPYIITSGYREPGSNLSVENSAHESGIAVDLRCKDSPTRFKIFKGLIAVGFCRMGAYDSHIHVDNDESKPQGVFWLGGKSK